MEKEDIMVLALTEEEFENIQRQYDDLYISTCTWPDQDFIAQARGDVPVLVNEVLRLSGILKSHRLIPSSSLKQLSGCYATGNRAVRHTFAES